MNIQDNFGNTPFHYFVCKKVFNPSYNGTLLNNCMYYDQQMTKLIEYIIIHGGGNMEIKNNDGRTVFLYMCAQCYIDVDVIKLCIENKYCNINTCDRLNSTVLHTLISNLDKPWTINNNEANVLSITKCLIENGYSCMNSIDVYNKNILQYLYEKNRLNKNLISYCINCTCLVMSNTNIYSRFIRCI